MQNVLADDSINLQGIVPGLFQTKFTISALNRKSPKSEDSEPIS